MLADLLEAKTVRSIIDVIPTLSAERRIGWRNVGDNENNLATIDLGTDPAAGIIERITNAIDAVLEREWKEQGEPTGVDSPRKAVERWFDIPDGRLVNAEDLRADEIVDLSNRAQVTLHDSERSDRPTVDIRDFGIGIKTEDFDKSILSLHGSRKLRKMFLAGAYGQGGSTALSYSQYAIIISRPAPVLQADADHVTATIVRFNPGDPAVDKHGVYEYMVDHSTGHPLVLDLDGTDFPPGTLVRHISMDLGKYKNILTAPTGSLWYLSHHYLFDPVLPFRIIEGRDNSSEGATRTVAGNHRLLTHADVTEYDRSATLTFRSGTVRMRWWVLTAEGDNSRNRITQYTLPSKPIIITYNGQKQGDLPNTIIKKDLRYPYLERYIVVHVDCDELDNESRRQLFPTTRESLRETALMDDLRRLVTDTLAGDSELARLDRARKDRYMRRVESASVENIRRRLASRVKAVVGAATGGRSPRVTPPEPRPDHPDRPPIPVQEPPTLLEIVSPDPRKIYAGKRFTLRFRTDADPAYFANPDTFLAVVDPPTFAQYTGTTNVRDGYGTAYFLASEELEEGATGKITFEVRPHRAASLRDSINAEVVPLPAEGGPGAGNLPTPNINPQWVNREDEFWREQNWNERSVAKVIRTEDSIDVFVSADNRLLSSLIERAQRRNTAAVDAIKDFYLEHISFYAVLAEIEGESRMNGGEDGGEPGQDPDEVDAATDREIRRACEMLTGVIKDLFDVVATGSTVEADEDESEEAEAVATNE